MKRDAIVNGVGTLRKITREEAEKRKRFVDHSNDE